MVMEEEKKKIKVKKRRKSSQSSKTGYRIAAGLCGLVFLGAVLFISFSIAEQRKAEEQYAAMRGAQDAFVEATVKEQEEALAEAEEEEPEEEPVEEERRSDAPLLENTVDFDRLHQTTEDIYAWIQIPGTLVDYPILQHPTDDSYYLDHTPEGAAGLPGSIYTESVHPKDFSAPLTVIYGHNMRNDTMFGSLHDYEKADKLEESPYVYIFLPDKTLVYQVFAAVRFSDAYLPARGDYAKEEDFVSFVDELRGSAGNVREDVEVPFGSKIIVMSTCIGNAPKNRFFVAAVQVDEYGK